MEDLSKCPQCGGEADNGIDRCIPPSAYMCRKCCIQEDKEKDAAEWKEYFKQEEQSKEKVGEPDWTGYD